MPGLLRYKKILWAVDAFQPDQEALFNTARQVAAFASSFGAAVEVAFAYHIPQLFMDKRSFKIFQAPYLREAEDTLEEVRDKLKGVKSSCRVLANEPGKRGRDEVSMLLDRAKKGKFDLIAVATHGRGAVMKFFIGSFADGLMMSSKLPLLVLGPHLKPGRRKIGSVLFPTDFSKSSGKAFSALVDDAARMKFAVRVVNGIVNEFIPPVASDAVLMGDYYPVGDNQFQRNVERSRALLKNMLAPCRRRGVKASGDIYGSGGRVSDIIAEAAEKRGADLIVMTSRASHSPRESLGSVTRKTVRKAPAPVLVIRR